MQVAVQIRPQLFAGLFLQNTELMLLASASLRMYTLGLIGVAVQYALVDGLTAMGKVRYAFPLSIFRKLLYMACIFILPMVTDICHVFYAGSISDIVGATFSAVVFFTAIIPRLRREMQPEET